ncbi:MAG: gamma-glutamyl-phosphate reductase, partial [Candidatus Omnitrophica bacterium]|nr:gamma-glutamyl-phosphate reductase [Candidatus Omnitrophota bacterium]
MNWKRELERVLAGARQAASHAGQESAVLKKKLLFDIASRIEKKKKWLVAENHKDLIKAKMGGFSSAMIDRLTLNEGRVRAMAAGVRAVALLKDPIGRVQARWTRPNGLKLQ